jgi:hypothetical protein
MPESMRALVISVSIKPGTTAFTVSSIAPSKDAERQFKDAFGRGASLVLVRLEGYVAFTGRDSSLDRLVAYPR